MASSTQRIGKFNLRHKTVLIPEMNRVAAHLMAATFRSFDSDAIVILMGSDRDRILESLDVYAKLSGLPIIIIETDSANMKSNSKAVYNAMISRGIPSDSITLLQGNAESTFRFCNCYWFFRCNIYFKSW